MSLFEKEQGKGRKKLKEIGGEKAGEWGEGGNEEKGWKKEEGKMKGRNKIYLVWV